jgi:hypothetical protein
VDQNRFKFPPPAATSPADPEPEIYTLLKDRPVAPAVLPDGSTAWLVSGFEQVRRVVGDQRFSRVLASAPGRSLQALKCSPQDRSSGWTP